MKPENKVATLEQAKKLVELGVVLETEKKWVRRLDQDNFDLETSNQLYVVGYELFPAPDVAELGELLPREVYIPYESCLGGVHYYTHVVVQDFERGFECSIGTWESFLMPTEAQARCAALIWLYENNYLER